MYFREKKMKNYYIEHLQQVKSHGKPLIRSPDLVKITLICTKLQAVI